MTEVACTVTIRKVATGEVRSYSDKWNNDGGAEYDWRDGNFSCDCNRGIFFTREANGMVCEDVPEEELECGDGRYRVKITDADGKLLYQDEDF